MKSHHTREFSCGKLVLLAPADAFVPRRFENVATDAARHDGLLASLQRLRGKLYFADGAIAAKQIAPDGRHRLADDEQAWHVLSLDERDEVVGCSRYLAHPNTIGFNRLMVRNAAVAASLEWGNMFRSAVAHEMERARRRGVSYVEVGGWALTPKLRRTREGLRLALATYGLARALGGCIGIATATQRHCSSEILRRIGGRSLHLGQIDFPSYYDPQYGCEMEVLRFDSIESSPRFDTWVNKLASYWLSAPVIRNASAPQWAPVGLPAYAGAYAGLARLSSVLGSGATAAPALGPTRVPAYASTPGAWAFEEKLTLAVQ
jgi:hypothetical protein